MTTKLTQRGSLVALSIVTIALLAGCSGTDVPVNLDEEIQMRDERITQLETEARQTQANLDRAQREAEEAARRALAAEQLAESNSTTIVPSNLEGEMLPPNAKAGECYARVLVPPVFETTSERMLVKEASESIAIVPAKYEWTEEQVVTKEASEKLIVEPATYKTVTEEVLVKSAGKRMVEVPAVYETVTEKILVTPAREYWKKGRGPIEKVDGSTGEIMCLVKEEAVYNTVSKKVLKTAATTREETIPAEYKTVTRTVLDKPARTRTEVIPAEYGVVKVQKMITPPQRVSTPVEAEYRTVTKTAMTEPSYMEWRQILCETNMHQATITDIQKALKAKGYNPGPIDGIYGSQTQSAINAFQEAKNLGRGSLTYETVEALGLSY